MSPRGSTADHRRLIAVTLDEDSIGRANPDIEHERAAAIYDLLEQNSFTPEAEGQGPYTLHLSVTGARLVFDIRREDGSPVPGSPISSPW